MSAVPFTVKAIFDYASDHEDDLVFSIGQIITVTEEEDEDWYAGTYTDDHGQIKEGIFPRNFVERYEPPRPAARPQKTKKRDSISASRPVDPIPSGHSNEAISQKAGKPENVVSGQPSEEEGETNEPSSSFVIPVANPKTSHPIETYQGNVTSAEAEPKPQETPVEPTTKKPPPPPAKSSSSAFKDRIAAFNKPDSTPPAFKSNPNRHSYVPSVPPSHQAPFEGTQGRGQEEHRVSHSQSSDDPVPSGSPIANKEGKDREDEEEHQPITTLKERIALLQKQQLAQQGHGHPKKEKPKKPAEKPRGASVDEQAPVESTFDSSGNNRPQNISYEHRESTESRSGADREDAETTTTTAQKGRSSEEHEPSRPSTAGENENRDQEVDETGDQRETEESGEEDEEEEVDPEIQKRIAIRERVARMSGGVGMHAMFGGPPGLGGIPGGGHAKKTKSISSESSHRRSIEHAEPPPVQAPPVPLPGLERQRQTVVSKSENEEKIEEESEEESSRPATTEETVHKAESSRDSSDEAPHAPSGMSFYCFAHITVILY